MTRRSIVTVESKFATGQIDACGYIRVRLPMNHPTLASDFEVVPASPRAALRTTPDALLVQRAVVEDLELARELIEHCRRNDIALIYEIDDDLFAIPEGHPEFLTYRRRLAASKAIAAAASAVIVSTEPLARALGAFNPSIVILPDTLDERLWLAAGDVREADDDALRILYMGTYTHGADVALLERPMRRLQRKHGPRVRLEIVGVTLDDPDWFDRFPVPNEVARSYPRFVAWLKGKAERWHIGVAPLSLSTFNESKSIIKFLDYSCLGLVTVLSDVPPYDGDIGRAGYPARVAQNTEDAWFETLDALVSNQTAARDLVRRARHAVVTHHTLQSQAAFRGATWRRLTGLGARPAPSHAVR